jgi:hypothetical protein
MKKVLILVEGQTEETFVREVLYPHCAAFDIYLSAKLATTHRVTSGPDFKGGSVSYGKIKADLKRLLQDTSATLVTTMIDFYRLPPDFPGKTTIPAAACYEQVAYLEDQFKRDIAHRRFLPYFALHEFEAMMFVSPDHIIQAFPGLKPTICDTLRKIKTDFGNPETINDQNPPSVRLLDLIHSYQKAWHGPLVTLEIGIDRIRAECPHFNQWLLTLESC